MMVFGSWQDNRFELPGIDHALFKLEMATVENIKIIADQPFWLPLSGTYAKWRESDLEIKKRFQDFFGTA